MTFGLAAGCGYDGGKKLGDDSKIETARLDAGLFTIKTKGGQLAHAPPLWSASSSKLAGDQLHVSDSHHVAQVNVVKRIKGRGPESRVPVIDHADNVGHVNLAEFSRSPNKVKRCWARLRTWGPPGVLVIERTST